MVIKISNKDIHRYKYMRRKIYLKLKKSQKSNTSFGEIYSNIQGLKARGVISVSNIDISISEAIKNQ